MSIVRENLLTRPGYTPYCGADRCPYHMPRTKFTGTQFKCECGWRTSFEPEFIEKYEQAVAISSHQRANQETKT